EYWQNDIKAKNNYFAKLNYNQSVFDAQLHYIFNNASTRNGNYDRRYILNGTEMNNHPALAVTRVENHDSPPGPSVESVV
ncbi:alpha-amylase, partial [Bacillus cereus]|nr:alpha-amylase [Bacillus cereus]